MEKPEAVVAVFADHAAAEAAVKKLNLAGFNCSPSAPMAQI